MEGCRGVEYKDLFAFDTEMKHQLARIITSRWGEEAEEVEEEGGGGGDTAVEELESEDLCFTP